MRARFLLNGILLLAACLLFAWLYLGQRQPQHESVSTLDSAAVQRIQVERQGEVDLLLARAEQGWYLQQPRHLPASEQHVEMLLHFLQLPVTARYALADIDLAGAGLLEPALVLRVDGQRFHFGGQEPLSLRRYILHADQVLLVQEGVSAILRSPWWNFIDRRLLVDAAPRGLRFADGSQFQPADELSWQQHWQRGQAAIVKPLAPDQIGEQFELELTSGERIAWQWLAGEQSYLLRPDLGLAYQVGAEQLQALLGRP